MSSGCRNAPPHPSAPADSRALPSVVGTRLAEATVAESHAVTFPRHENRFIHMHICWRPWRVCL